MPILRFSSYKTSENTNYSDRKQIHDCLCQRQIVEFGYNGIDDWFLPSAHDFCLLSDWKVIDGREAM